MPSCGFAAWGSVRTSANIIEHHCAYEVQTLWPLTTKCLPSGSSTALVRTAARSEPAPGSEKPCAHQVLLWRMSGRYLRFCSSVPNAISTGPSIWMPLAMMRGAPPSSVSSSKM